MINTNSFVLVSSLFLSLAQLNVARAADQSAEKFEKETSIHWTLKIDNDSSSRLISGKEIDRELEAGVLHSGLGVRCTIGLTRKAFDYDGRKVTYARDEESAVLSCGVAGYAVSGKQVVCAKGRAKNKVGTVYSDATELVFAKDGRTYDVRLSCSVK